MNKKGLPATVYLLAAACTHAQSGSVQVTFMPFNGGRPMVLQVAAPFLKSDHPGGCYSMIYETLCNRDNNVLTSSA